MRQLMDLEIDQAEAAARLERLGLAPTFGNAAALSLLDKAVREGNATAFQTIREALGEKGERPISPDAADLRGLTDSQLLALLGEDASHDTQ